MDQKQEGRFATHPPLLKGENFFHWKVCMQVFLGAIDEWLWNSIEFGWEHPKKTVGEVTTLKPRKEWTKEEKIESVWNRKGLNALYNALSTSKFHRIISCTTSKDAWDT